MGETVILKSGKSIQGEVAEQSDDYILVDIDGVVLKYYRNEIERIDLDTSGESLDEGLYPASSDQKAWVKWFDRARNYLDKVDEILGQTKKIRNEATLKMQDTKRLGYRTKVKQALTQAKGTLGAFRKELIAFRPPKEFALYHKEAKNSLRHTMQFIDAILIGDNASASKYLRRALQSTREILKEKKRIFAERKSPQEEIDAIENSLGEIDSSLNY